jgi:MFS family permease
MLVFLAANICAAKADSYNSLIATRIVGGLGGDIIEALGPLIVSEFFLEHQLGRAMVTYIRSLAVGSGPSPISSGFIGTHLGS